MRINLTVVLTFILLSLMCAAGGASFYGGYKVGSEALKGITQPDSSPTSTLAKSKMGHKILSEAEILAKVKAKMSGK
ncbi:MAG: hypothetical protein AB4352_14015 [Hormoscilla sp.]